MQDNLKRCKKCKAILWVELDGDRVKITDLKGQDLEIGYNFIRVVCKKCGQVNKQNSEASELIQDLFLKTSTGTPFTSVMQVEERPYEALSNSEKRTLFKSLSERQRKIFDVMAATKFTALKLAKDNPFITELIRKLEVAGKELAPDEISDKRKQAISDINTIDTEIKKIKPNFGIRHIEMKELTE